MQAATLGALHRLRRGTETVRWHAALPRVARSGLVGEKTADGDRTLACDGSLRGRVRTSEADPASPERGLEEVEVASGAGSPDGWFHQRLSVLDRRKPPGNMEGPSNGPFG